MSGSRLGTLTRDELLDYGEDDDQDAEQQRERGAEAELPEHERLLVDLGRQRLRGAGGTASGEGHDLVEDAETLDEHEGGGDRDRGTDRGQRDVDEPAPSAGAVDGRGLLDLDGDDG